LKGLFVEITEKTKIEDISLYDYLEIAQKCVSRFTSGQLRTRMLQDEDAIAHVAEKLMVGAHAWDATRGKNLRNYLTQCSRWAIFKWIVATTKQRKRTQANNEDLFYNARLVTMPDTTAENSEFLEEALGKLTTTQSRYVRLVMIEGLSFADVGRACNVSRQTVEQTVHYGINRLRSHYAKVY
jgi:RNA polymerase sigma factor (sigma-70 family)